MASFIKSLGFAFNGITHALRTERHFLVHTVAALLVIIAGILFHIEWIEWICIVTAIGAVLAAELFNTVVEHVCDFIQPGKHQAIKHIKDMAAAAVLLTAVAAFITGLLIFLPRIIALF